MPHWRTAWGRPPRDRPGRVYVLSTRHPDVTKIGFTLASPMRRAADLSCRPGYRGFTPLRVAWWIETPNPARVEALAHRMLRRRRIRLRAGCEELFRADVPLARRTIETAVARLTPRPPLWRRVWRALALLVAWMAQAIRWRHP